MSDLGSSSSSPASRRDFYWLAAAVVGAALLHFGWTVPRGPFEESKRNRDRHRKSFASQRDKLASSRFEREPSNGPLVSEMRACIRRAVQLARTQAIAGGSRHWSQASKIDCRTSRCRFEVCLPAAMQSSMESQLASFQISRRPAWEFKRIEAGACPRYEVRFLETPGLGKLLSLK